jgi:hypothetical protein
MHPRRLTLGWIIILGGLAVLASYGLVSAVDPEALNRFWGGVPQAWLPYYLGSMLLATLGYFAYTYFVFFQVEPQQTRIAGRFGYGLFPVLYLMILVPSALWMPLTWAMVQQPANSLWIVIRLALAMVGLGSLGVLIALLTLRPRQPAWAYWLAVVGSIAFSIQTAVLDAFVWTALFPT